MSSTEQIVLSDGVIESKRQAQKTHALFLSNLRRPSNVDKVMTTRNENVITK